MRWMPLLALQKSRPTFGMLGPGWKVWVVTLIGGLWSLLCSAQSCQGPTACALTTEADCCPDQLPLVRICALCGQGFMRECGPVIQNLPIVNQLTNPKPKSTKKPTLALHLAGGPCLGKGGTESQGPVYHHRCLWRHLLFILLLFWSAFPGPPEEHGHLAGLCGPGQTFCPLWATVSCPVIGPGL